MFIQGVFIKKISQIILILIFISSCRDDIALDFHESTEKGTVNLNQKQTEQLLQETQETQKTQKIKPRERLNTQRTFPKSFDKIFTTISPNQTIKGPILNIQTSSFDKYADTIIEMALKEAHKISKEYLVTKEYKKYYTMMLLSLVVPTHESMILHFRQIKNAPLRCSDKKNNGETLLDQNITKTNFMNAFRSKTKPFLVGCSELKSDQELYQLIAGGADGSDIGIMQVSTRWHYENYLETEKFRSVLDSLNYGINYLHDGFKRIARNANKYPCILKQNKTIDYHKLARATWGGWYNGGQAKKACRFTDLNSKHINKDNLFNKNLKQMIKSGEGKPFGNIIGKGPGKMLTFPISKKMEQIIQEISKNILSGTNSRSSLKTLIGQ